MEKFLTHNQEARIMKFLNSLGTFNYRGSALEHASFMGICENQEKRLNKR